MLNTDRRSLFAGTAAAAVAATIPAPVSASSRSAWDTAMARYRAASAAHASYAKAVHDPVMHRGTIPDHIAERMDALGCELSDAEDDLLDLPAPHEAALRWKIEFVMKDEGDGFLSPWSKGAVKQTLADAARLLPTAA